MGIQDNVPVRLSSWGFGLLWVVEEHKNEVIIKLLG